MNRPSMQFYCGDWRSNTKLGRCTFAERGIWIEVLCLMHDSATYGVLHWPLKDLAQAVGCRVADLQSLRAKGVLKGADSGERCDPYVHQGFHARKPLPPATLIPEQAGPIWYSSRMVRDEYNRTRRGVGSRFTTELQPDRAPIRAPDEAPIRAPVRRQGDGASSSSSNKPPIAPQTGGELFDRFWKAYPRKEAKQDAIKRWRRLAVDVALLSVMLDALSRQCDSVQWQKNNGEFIPYPATWLHKRRWEDEDGAGAVRLVKVAI